MSLEAKLTQLAVAVGTDVKTLNDRLGLNANLTTTQKATIVGAINELVTHIGDMTKLDDGTFTPPSSFVTDAISEPPGYTWTLRASDTASNPSYYIYSIDPSSGGVGLFKFDNTTGKLYFYNPAGDWNTYWADRTTTTYLELTAGVSPRFAFLLDYVKGGYTNLVDAIIAALDAGNIAASLINDNAGDGITDKTWSANKIYDSILAAINQLRDDLVNGSGAALDTLKELADALGNDPNFATTIAEGLAKRVRVDAAQTFTSAEKLQGRENIDAASNTEFQTLKTDLGDVTHDFLADYTTARDLMV